MFVVAMVMRYSQACHVHRSAAATRSRHTRMLSFWPASGIHSAVSLSERKSLWRSIRAGPTSLSSFLCHCRTIIIKMALKFHEFTHSQTLSKRCKSSTEPRGSKRGLVLNLCLLILEMTSSVRYNLILIRADPIRLTSTHILVTQYHERWLGVRGSEPLWHSLRNRHRHVWEHFTMNRLLPKVKANPASRM